MKRIIVAAMALGFATPALADFYILQDTGTKKCTIAQSPPIVSSQTVVNPNGAIYKTEQEATTAMKSAKACEAM